MQIASRYRLDEEQSRILMNACDLTWLRILEARVPIIPTQQAHLQNIVRNHLLRQVRRGERNVTRLASRGVFLICGVLACSDSAYVPGRPLQAGGTQIIF